MPGTATMLALAFLTVLPLLVMPAGTFNHFATDLGIRSAQEAVVALRDGEAVLVDVGVAGRRPFVNTWSTGIYVDLVQAREGSGWRTHWQEGRRAHRAISGTPRWSAARADPGRPPPASMAVFRW
jgi:diacylglycerol kinase family enzyme